MKINIISVGKIKEKWLIEGIEMYKKRISHYSNIELIIVNDESNDIDEKRVKKLEGERILAKLPPNSYNVVLDLKGEMLSSEGLAQKIIDITNYSSSTINFIIGGSLGLDSEVIKKADYKISFSKMTFPHQLMKLILLEQIYRVFKINNNESYHK